MNLKICIARMLMKDFKKEMEKKISDLFSNFQKVHLSENTNSIRTHLANNTISIRSESCLTASEKKLIKPLVVFLIFI